VRCPRTSRRRKLCCHRIGEEQPSRRVEIGGHARRIDVVLHGDGSLAVTDDGRGMPVDVHPEHGVTGVELILTRLHAGVGRHLHKNLRQLTRRQGHTDSRQTKNLH
jgi:hypothetical protein